MLRERYGVICGKRRQFIKTPKQIREYSVCSEHAYLQKKQSIIISKEPIRYKLVAYNKIIQQVLKFNYLGIIISTDLPIETWQRKLRKRTNMANGIAGYLRDIIWRNWNMSTEGNMRIYKTCIRPILTYTTETTVETSKIERILRTTEMRTLEEKLEGSYDR